MTKEDLSGKKFNHWTVLEFYEMKNGKECLWKCICDCGNIKNIRASSLKTGNSKSCGCARSKDFTGEVYGKLTVLDKYLPEIYGSKYWNCLCECGVTKYFIISQLTSHRRKDCGCGQHHMSRTREYSSWQGMKARCYNKNHMAFMDYGGRGIKVSEDWINSFLTFFDDMGECPEGMSLDRIDVNGDYCKENCRWSDFSIQNFNQRVRITNTSGVVGVGWHKQVNKWRAYIAKDSLQISLGVFESFEEACRARLEAEIKYYGTPRDEKVTETN